MVAYGPSGNVTSADLANVMPTLISPAREYIEKKTFLTEFVTQITLADGDGLSINMPKFGTVLQAQALAENVPISNPQRLIPSTQQFTASEIGCEVILTDRAMKRTPEPMMARAGRFLGNAIRRKKEQDIIALFPGLTRDLGGAGTTFKPADVAAAFARLSAGAETAQDEPAPPPYAGVLHPFHYFSVLTAAASLGTMTTPQPMPGGGITARVTEDYYVGTLYNVPLDLHPLIPVDGSDDAVGAIFAKETFVMIKTSNSFTKEQERDIHLRAWDIVVTAEYGTGTLENQFGFCLTADATAPNP